MHAQIESHFTLLLTRFLALALSPTNQFQLFHSNLCFSFILFPFIRRVAEFWLTVNCKLNYTPFAVPFWSTSICSDFTCYLFGLLIGSINYSPHGRRRCRGYLSLGTLWLYYQVLLWSYSQFASFWSEPGCSWASKIGHFWCPLVEKIIVVICRPTLSRNKMRLLVLTMSPRLRRNKVYLFSWAPN